MNADMFLHGLSIINDAKIMFKNITSKNKSTHYISYISSFIGNIEHTFEMIYELLKLDKTKLFQKKKVVILMIEIIKFMFKLKELNHLKKEGFNFFVEKNIYFNQFLQRNEEDELGEINLIDTNNILQIKNKKSLKNYNFNTNLIKIPDRISSRLIKIDVNSTDDSIKFPNPIENKIEFNNNLNNQEFLIRMKEILYLIRPVIYMASLIYFKEKKIIPLIISMIIDYLYLDGKANMRGNFSKQKIYHLEYAYRIRRLFIYFLRDPILSYVTIPFIKKILSFIRMPESVIRWVELILKYFTKYYYIL